MFGSLLFNQVQYHRTGDFTRFEGQQGTGAPPPPPFPEHPHPPSDGRIETFSRMFIQEGLRSNQDFGWELAIQVGVIFFRWDLKTLCVKNSEYESQAKKMILIVLSTISHFWSPTFTYFWQSVFLSLFSMVYNPRYPEIFLCACCSQELGRFQISWGPSVLGDLISFLRLGAKPFSSIKPSHQ